MFGRPAFESSIEQRILSTIYNITAFIPSFPKKEAAISEIKMQSHENEE